MRPLPSSVSFFRGLWNYLWFTASWFFFEVYSRHRVVGREHLKPGEPALLLANHQSAWDSYVIGEACFPRLLYYPAKIELHRHWLVGPLIRSLNSFPLKRGVLDFRAMARIRELLQSEIVVLHPEGTRSPDGRLQPGRPGVGKLVHETQAPVIPVYLHNVHRLLPKGALWPRPFRPLAIYFGEPLDFSAERREPFSKELAVRIVERVMAAIAALQEEALGAEQGGRER